MDILDDIKIDVEAFFLENKSEIGRSLYFFMYKVTISNHTDKTIQLLSRYWNICDANGSVQIIEGEGVIGEQPIMEPNASFQYNSFCPLKTEFGKMSGFYTFKEEETNNLFKGIIPGDYLLQCYENYNLSTEIAYPYFAGKADSDQASLHFSNIFGPVEARANWDIENIIIELK